MIFFQFRYIPALHYNKIFFCKQCKRRLAGLFIVVVWQAHSLVEGLVYWLTSENLRQSIKTAAFL